MRVHQRSERGAAAVEFAIILPILALLVFGIVEYGRLFAIEASLSNAARVGARTMAIEAGQGKSTAAADAQADAQAAALANPLISSGALSIPAPSSAPCAGGAKGIVSMSVNYTFTSLTGYVPVPGTLHAVGAMRCAG